MNPQRSTPRVLAVDDESFQLKLLGHQLAKLGLSDVVSCERASDALALIDAPDSSFDLVFCDLQMPGMDGVEFLRHLGERQWRGGVALISGEDGRVVQIAERLARAHSLRVLGALHKPVLPGELRRLIEADRLHRAPRPRAAAAPCAADELREAIAAGQLVNHYQPKVEIATGVVTGVETLVRWDHPRDGLVYPDRFIGVAEDNGLIDPLTAAVLAGPRGALRDAAAWQARGLQLQVAVNVSMDNLSDHAFPGFVADELARAGLPPSRLMLEVTESRLMKNPLATLDVLARLRLKRVALSIDDFGTGHSSLSQLRDIPFDELKIDRSFVHGAAGQDAQRAILLASLSMARQLGLKVVAEGVEDEADWRFLREHGCDLAQGWYIAKPMPAESVPGWIESWERRRVALQA